MTGPPPPGERRPAARPPAGAAGPRWGGDGALRRETEAQEAARQASRTAREAPSPVEDASSSGPGPSVASPAASALLLPRGAELATFRRRAIAGSVDFVLKSLLFQIVVIAAGIEDVAYPLPIAMLIAGQILSRGYDFIFFTRGRTPGAWLLGIKIVRVEDGAEPGVWRAFARAFGALLSEAALGLGYVWALRNPRRQTWHDSMARTIVVVAPRAPRGPRA